jgi:hypothetical protein
MPHVVHVAPTAEEIAANEQRWEKLTKGGYPAGRYTNVKRVCGTCLAFAVNTLALRVTVLFFQEHHRCEDCTRTTGVFVADIMDPLEVMPL